MTWTADDVSQILDRQTTIEEVERQLALFRRPPQAVELIRPCGIGDGIRRLSAAYVAVAPARCDEARRQGRMAKFVPASGAATRMFQGLVAARSSAASSAKPASRANENDEAAKVLREFESGLPRFAFLDELRRVMRGRGVDPLELAGRDEVGPIIDSLLSAEGLGYSDLPKGLLPFHRYNDIVRTAFEEHLIEAAGYVRDEDGCCRMHFTVSPEHERKFRDLLEQVRPAYEKRFDARFVVDFSAQKPSTDTLAVDLQNEPFRDEDGRLLFRPGGHGALVENLNDMRGDIVFVKNIDNVVPENRIALVIQWKQALAACLLDLQAEIFRHLAAIEEPSDSSAIEAAERFASTELCLPVPRGADLSQRRSFLSSKLDRPLRVCGVVKNVGEPGGGPFWVRGAGGSLSLQIIEHAQVAAHVPRQQEIFEAASHFNPVDIVCGVRDQRDQCFDLNRFTDADAVFIARKSSGGRELKALERPGLWNGGMANWNTVFVEVPLETFNPVKTVLDLLRPEHQPADGE